MKDKKIDLLYKMKSNPDVAAIEIAKSAGYIAISELERILEEGIQDDINSNKSLSPLPDYDNLLETDRDSICLTFQVASSLKMHLTRAEAEQFLEDARNTLKSPPVNPRYSADTA